MQELLKDGATLIDGREPREFDAAHIPGSINVTMVKAAVGTRAAWVVEPNTEAVVTAASDHDAKRLALMLEAVGFRQRRRSGIEPMTRGAHSRRRPAYEPWSSPRLDQAAPKGGRGA